MKFSTLGSRAALVSSLFLSSTLADNSSVPSVFSSSSSGPSGMSLGINIPDNGTKDDLYFAFTAPADSHSWAGFGVGTTMNNALMFIVYQSGQSEPTVSARTASGHSMPTQDQSVNVTVQPSSNVNNNVYTANFYCTGCRSWGSNNGIDITSTSQSFFLALGPSTSLTSSDASVSIRQHDSTPETFTMDVTKAVGTGGVPVISSNTATNNTTSNGPSGTGGPPGSDGSDNDGDNPLGITRGIAVHGFLMCFAFALVFPGGYLFLRMFEKVWLHWPVQSLGTLLVILGFAAGVAASIKNNISPKLTHPHQIIGILATLLVLAAWTLGLIGHMMYKRHGVPSPLIKVHRFVGPSAILLGFVNACIGLAWIGAARAIIGYAIFNILVAIVVGSLVLCMRKRRMRKQAMNSNAAQNFREGAQWHQGGPPPPAYGQNVPMQTFRDHPQQPHSGQQGHMEYYNAQPK